MNASRDNFENVDWSKLRLKQPDHNSTLRAQAVYNLVSNNATGQDASLTSCSKKCAYCYLLGAGPGTGCYYACNYKCTWG